MATALGPEAAVGCKAGDLPKFLLSIIDIRSTDLFA